MMWTLPWAMIPCGRKRRDFNNEEEDGDDDDDDDDDEEEDDDEGRAEFWFHTEILSKP